MSIFRGLIGIFRRTKAPVYVEDTEFWAKCSREVEKGKRKDPLMMTADERREATRKVTRKMKWSPTFAEAMKLPLALRALEAGGSARDPLTQEWFSLDDDPDHAYAKVKHMSRQDFIDNNAAWKAAPLFTVPEMPKEEEL